MGNLVLRQAIETDLEPLVAMYQSVRDWLAARGSDQWATYASDVFRESMTLSIEDNCCFVVIDGDQLLGTITVDSFADAEFWNGTERAEDALYLHRMMVDRKAAGRNLGRFLLDHAENLAAASGKHWLRLDAWRTNVKLHNYYLQQGFVKIRIISLDHRGSGALFQRPTRAIS